MKFETPVLTLGGGIYEGRGGVAPVCGDFIIDFFEQCPERIVLVFSNRPSKDALEISIRPFQGINQTTYFEWRPEELLAYRGAWDGTYIDFDDWLRKQPVDWKPDKIRTFHVSVYEVVQ